MSSSNLDRIQENLNHWQSEAARNERERAVIGKVALGGLPVGIAAGFWRPLAGAAGVGLCILFYLMGMYMTWVRRGEFRENIAEAQSALKIAQAEVKLV